MFIELQSQPVIDSLTKYHVYQYYVSFILWVQNSLMFPKLKNNQLLGHLNGDVDKEGNGDLYLILLDGSLPGGSMCL